MAKSASWYASRYVDKFGFTIVPIEPGRKFPITDNWGLTAINDASAAVEFYQSNPTWGMGLVLNQSRMCSLDIDDEAAFTEIMDAWGFELPALELKTMPTIRGRGRRITFRVPDGVTLPYHKLDWPKQDDPSKRFTVFELRASDGKQRQDVLPPSIHPDTGNPYAWEVQPPASLADWPVPPDWLLHIWQDWEKFKPQLKALCPWAPIEEPRPRGTGATIPVADGDSVIDQYNTSVTIYDALTQYGYKRKGRRWLSPHSGTGLPGVHVFPDSNRCWIHHASDPLCSDESGAPVGPFDLFCYYENNGDVKAAAKAAAKLLGLKPKRPASASSAVSDPVRHSAPPSPDPMPTDIDASESSDVKYDRESPWLASGAPFRPLGYNEGIYYYLPNRSNQVVAITAAGHGSSANLLAISALEWWESTHPKGGDSAGVAWTTAANSAMRWCESVGVFNEDSRRGRGAWHDKGRSVMHLGDRLIVGGTETSLHSFDTRYIYESKPPMHSLAIGAPASDELSLAVFQLFKSLRLSCDADPLLLAGWCALAPICGALKWRPHAWLTGQRGSGKTWVFNNMVMPIVGSAAVAVQGNSSEAGIRQTLGQDALPIVFDEAEGEAAIARARLQSIIELARQASSDGSGKITKGGTNGRAQSFRVRSMFLLGSINVNLIQASDKSRFSVFNLKSSDKTAESVERFKSLSDRSKALLSPANCDAIRSRMYAMIPVIRHNADLFAHAAAMHLGNQRAGDQIGALLAGGYALTCGDKITHEIAMSVVEAYEWNSDMDGIDETDEETLLGEIMQSQIRVNASHTMGVAEVIDALRGDDNTDAPMSTEYRNMYEDALARHGVRYDGERVIISATHKSIRTMLKDTAWAQSWHKVLLRIEGAKALTWYRFAGGGSRAVSVPVSAAIDSA